jgi:hypothetical protein
MKHPLFAPQHKNLLYPFAEMAKAHHQLVSPYPLPFQSQGNDEVDSANIVFVRSITSLPVSYDY